MRRKWALVGAGVLVLCLLGILPVLAQGPDQNPIYATIEYVDQVVSEMAASFDQQIAALTDDIAQEIARLDARIDAVGGGSVGEDFDLPDEQDWHIRAYSRTEAGQTVVALSLSSWDPDDLGRTCSWNGVPITQWAPDIPGVQTRAVARYNGAPLGYAVGTCNQMSFGALSYLPEVGETVEVDISFFWMGKEKQITIPITVTEPPNRMPHCSLSADPGSGYAPLDVTFTATTSDPDGDEIVQYLWEFGDGTVLEGSEVEVHTYTNAGGYYPLLWIVDARGGEANCDSDVYVD
jgi:hypothetical protein